MVGMKSDAELLQVVGALNPASRLAGRLNRRKQQRDQNGDDSDDDQQLDQRETTTDGRTLGGNSVHAFQCLILK